MALYDYNRAQKLGKKQYQASLMKGEHPYVLTVLSDAYEHLDLLDALVKEIDQAHTELLRNR